MRVRNDFYSETYRVPQADSTKTIRKTIPN